MKFTKLLIPALSLGLLAACASSPTPVVSEDGLELIKVKNIDTMYWQPGASLAGYDQVMIMKPEVSFRKNWMRDQNRDRRALDSRIKSEDMDRISAAVAEAFTERFTLQLENGGYRVVDSRGEGVLVLKPAIINLDVNAPDVSMRQVGMQTSYTTSAGEMTLQLELLDGPTQSVIGRATDRREARPGAYIQVSNRITNTAEANLLLDGWARQLVRALDEAQAE